MQIQTPSTVGETLFDGALQALDAERAADPLRAQIGRPEWWRVKDLLGRAWRPPQGGDTHLLVRLVFALEPPHDYEVEEAEFTVKLARGGQPRSPVAFDAFPTNIQEETRTDVTLTLAPSLKLQEVEASPGSVETTIHLDRVEPVVTTRGIGESDLTWHFRKHRRHPLLGTRFVYLVLAVPAAISKVEVQLGLDAADRGRRFGLRRFATPRSATQQLTYAIDLSGSGH